MKKGALSIAATTLALTLALAGCGSGDDNDAKGSTSEAIETVMKIGSAFDESTHKAFSLEPNRLKVQPIYTQSGFAWLSDVDAKDDSKPSSTDGISDFNVNYQSLDGEVKWSKVIKAGGDNVSMVRTIWDGQEYVTLVQVNPNDTEEENPLANSKLGSKLVAQSFSLKDGATSDSPLNLPIEMKRAGLGGIAEADRTNNVLIIHDAEKSRSSVLNPDSDRLVYSVDTGVTTDNLIPIVVGVNSSEILLTHQGYSNSKVSGILSSNWSNTDITPVSSNGSSIISYKLSEDKENLTSYMMDSDNGRILAQSECDTTSNMGSSNMKRFVQSSNGKFAFSSGFIFESGGGAACLYDTDTSFGVDITAISDDGVAFGMSSQGKVIQYDATGAEKPKLIEDAEVTPLTISESGYALFGRVNSDKNPSGELINEANGKTIIEVAKTK